MSLETSCYKLSDRVNLILVILNRSQPFAQGLCIFFLVEPWGSRLNLPQEFPHLLTNRAIVELTTGEVRTGERMSGSTWDFLLMRRGPVRAGHFPSQYLPVLLDRVLAERVEFFLSVRC